MLRQTQAREEAELKRKKRTNRMLIAMVAIFVTCWLPLNCAHIIRDLFFYDHNLPILDRFQLAMHVLAMSSTIYNPFLYAYMNEQFRKEFQKLLPCLLRSRTQDRVTSTINLQSRSGMTYTRTPLVPRSPTSTIVLPFETSQKQTREEKAKGEEEPIALAKLEQYEPQKNGDGTNESVERLLKE